jgi:hypothetical protein
LWLAGAKGDTSQAEPEDEKDEIVAGKPAGYDGKGNRKAKP